MFPEVTRLKMDDTNTIQMQNWKKMCLDLCMRTTQKKFVACFLKDYKQIITLIITHKFKIPKKFLLQAS